MHLTRLLVVFGYIFICLCQNAMAHKPAAYQKNLLPKRDVCGESFSDRIFGGGSTDIDEFPWMVLLSYQKKSGGTEFLCGGTLINNRYVVTAAHCLKARNAKNVSKLVGVRLGEFNTNSGKDCKHNNSTNEDSCNDKPLDVAIEKVIVHEGYDPLNIAKYNDIGLLRLSTSVKYTQYIKPICLPIKDGNPRKYIGKSVITSGWGLTEKNVYSDTKLKVELLVKTNKECNDSYKLQKVKIIEKQLCVVGPKGKDSCNGDSGGPLMMIHSGNGFVNWELVGIVSFGSNPCAIKVPGVYTKVESYLDWIIGNLKK